MCFCHAGTLAFSKPIDELQPMNIVLRGPQAGDLGWVIQQHGQIYGREYQWDTSFEAFVAAMMAKYFERFDPATERFWMAEVDSQRAGSVFVARKSKRVAQLRALILLPEARGLGLGGRLVDECIGFARAQGYRTLMLWTNSCLLEARALYARRGFVLTASEPYRGFGQDLVGETWKLKL